MPRVAHEKFSRHPAQKFEHGYSGDKTDGVSEKPAAAISRGLRTPDWKISFTSLHRISMQGS
jgi:hypothetical protein